MSRSYRHNPFMGTCADSDKVAKVQANRDLRHSVKSMLHIFRNMDYEEDIVLPVMREVSNVWDFPKDGKTSIWESKHIRK